MKILVDQLNPGRATSDLERSVVAKALSQVARWAGETAALLPKNLKVDGLAVDLPIALRRIQLGFVTEDFVARYLARKIWEQLGGKLGDKAKFSDQEKAQLRQVWQRLPGDAPFHEGVEWLANREIAPGRYLELTQQMRHLLERSKHLSEAMESTQDEEGLFRAMDMLDEARMGASGTVRGSHGGKEGTTQQESASQAQTNWRKADQLVEELAARKEPLSLEWIAKLNAVLGEGLGNNGGTPGRYRGPGDGDVSAGGNFLKMYVPSDHVAEALQGFMRWYEAAQKAGMHPIELAASAYQRLVSIHPFMDANGRTCRMVMDWILRAHGLPAATLSDVNVAVFGAMFMLGIQDQIVAASKAVEAVAQGVEASLKALEAATYKK
ncbi:MAG: Fic family protein [Planctomycetota bacterium]